MQLRLIPIIRALFVETNPGPAKTALALMGRCAADLRLPLAPLSDASLERLTRALQDFGLVA